MDNHLAIIQLHRKPSIVNELVLGPRLHILHNDGAEEPGGIITYSIVVVPDSNKS